MLGPWRLEAQLGEGATSTVWAAQDQARGLRVALKVLKSDEVDEAIAQRRQLRMMRESEALVRSAHPNVVRIVEVGRVGARVYLAMELIQGVDLRTWLSQRRARPEVVSVYLQCARGLAAAHKAGIIHRDFKPAKVRCPSWRAARWPSS
jgi:serine/threonine-protein kinase